jgi:hypothetical protein
MPLQLVLAGRSSEWVGIVILPGRHLGAYPEFSRLTKSWAKFIDPPAWVENGPRITTIILIPVVGAVVQIKRREIDFVQINLKRR